MHLSRLQRKVILSGCSSEGTDIFFGNLDLIFDWKKS
jgi:hypothetical protein